MMAVSVPALHAQAPPLSELTPPRSTDPLADGPLLWDANHDGIYTCDEWKRYMDRLFVLADKNRDGILSASEFPVIKRVEKTFADADLGYFDDNGDGKVTRSEFINKPSLFIGQYDKNGDCRVTPDELKGGKPAAAPQGGGRRHGGGMGGMGGGGMGGGGMGGGMGSGF